MMAWSVIGALPAVPLALALAFETVLLFLAGFPRPMMAAISWDALRVSPPAIMFPHRRRCLRALDLSSAPPLDRLGDR